MKDPVENKVKDPVENRVKDPVENSVKDPIEKRKKMLVIISFKWLDIPCKKMLTHFNSARSIVQYQQCNFKCLYYCLQFYFY